MIQKYIIQYVYIITFCLMYLPTITNAQSDSIQIEVETIDDSANYFKTKYTYLDVTLSDDDNLLKLGFQPFKPNESFAFGTLFIETSLERKMNKSLTSTNEISAILSWSENSSVHQFGYSLGLRYYPTKKHEVSEKVSGNNCNGTYFDLKLKDLFYYISERSVGDKKLPDKLTSIIYHNREFEGMLKPQIGLGYQQRLRTHLYFDTSVTCSYTIINNRFDYGMKLLIGGLLSIPD